MSKKFQSVQKLDLVQDIRITTLIRSSHLIANSNGSNTIFDKVVQEPNEIVVHMDIGTLQEREEGVWVSFEGWSCWLQLWEKHQSMIFQRNGLSVMGCSF